MPPKAGGAGIEQAVEEGARDGGVRDGRVRDLYGQARAAYAERKFQEGSNMCSEALLVPTLNKADRVQLLLTRSKIYSQMDGFLLLALKDAKEAVFLAPQYAVAYVRAAKALHQAGHLAKANDALKMAETLARGSAVGMCQYTSQLYAKWNPPVINRLPDEVLINIFSYLNMSNIRACQLACRRWRNVTTSNAVLWRNGPKLKGTIRQVGAKLAKLYQRTGGGHIHALSFVFLPDTRARGDQRAHQSNRKSAWERSGLNEFFPYTTLKDFTYTGFDEDSDKEMWRCLLLCSQLKVLRWNVQEESYPSKARLWLRNTMLSECRLEEVYLSNVNDDKFDSSFGSMVSQAKTIHLQGSDLLHTAFRAVTEARDSVEELLTMRFLDSTMEVTDAMMSQPLPLAEDQHSRVIELKSLQRFYGQLPSLTWKDYGQEATPVTYSAPKATRVMSISTTAAVISLLNSCRASVVEVAYVHESEEASQAFVSLLYDFAQCEMLSIEMDFRQSLPGLWSHYLGASYSDTQVILLPKLKHLQISRDQVITGPELVELVKSRVLLGAPPLESLEIFQCPFVSPEAVEYLRTNVRRFYYSATKSRMESLGTVESDP